MNWLLARLKERSSWLALFTLAGLFGMKIEPELREHIINAILAVAAVAAFVFREDVRERDQLDKNDSLPRIELVGRSDGSAPVRDADPPINPLAPSSRFPLYRGAATQVNDEEMPLVGDGFRRYRDTDDDGLHDLPTERPPQNPAGWNG